jgi:hypothetical protein
MGVLMHTFDPLCVLSDLLGFDPATLNMMILYYHLITTRNQALANTYIWLQYGCFGFI